MKFQPRKLPVARHNVNVALLQIAWCSVSPYCTKEETMANTNTSEMNTSVASDITFAASPKTGTTEDMLPLLQLELDEQLRVYHEQDVTGHKTTKKKSKKVYRSVKGDVSMKSR